MCCKPLCIRAGILCEHQPRACCKVFCRLRSLDVDHKQSGPCSLSRPSLHPSVAPVHQQSVHMTHARHAHSYTEHSLGHSCTR